MSTGRYEVMKGTPTHSRFLGKKGAGRHVTFKAGAIVDLTNEEAKLAGDKVKRIDGGVRSETNDAPAPGLPDQYVPPVATRLVGQPQPTKGKPSTYTTPANVDTNWTEVVEGGKAGELKSLVEAMDNEAEVQALLDAENASDKPRATVVAAAEKRLAELQDTGD